MYFEVIKPDLAVLADWLEFQPQQIDMKKAEAHVTGAERLGRQLHAWLRLKLRGLARTWLKDKDPANGLQTWRDLLARYDPSTGSSLLDLQERICTVKRAKNLHDLSGVIDTFEAAYKVYRKKVGKELDDLTLQNLLLRMLPHRWERQMRFQMHTNKVQTDYLRLKSELLELAVNVGDQVSPFLDANSMHMEIGSQEWLNALPEEARTVIANHDPRLLTPWNADEEQESGEDLDALRAKGGKGRARDPQKGQGRSADVAKKKCSICLRANHLAKDCFANPEATGYKGEEYRKKTLEFVKQKQLKSLEVEEAPEGGLGGLQLGGLMLGCLDEFVRTECDLDREEDDDYDGVAEDEHDEQMEALGINFAKASMQEKIESSPTESDPWYPRGDPWATSTSMPTLPLSWEKPKVKISGPRFFAPEPESVPQSTSTRELTEFEKKIIDAESGQAGTQQSRPTTAGTRISRLSEFERKIAEVQGLQQTEFFTLSPQSSPSEADKKDMHTQTTIETREQETQTDATVNVPSCQVPNIMTEVNELKDPINEPTNFTNEKPPMPPGLDTKPKTFLEKIREVEAARIMSRPESATSAFDLVQSDDGPVHLHRHREQQASGKEVIWKEGDIEESFDEVIAADAEQPPPFIMEFEQKKAKKKRGHETTVDWPTSCRSEKTNGDAKVETPSHGKKKKSTETPGTPEYFDYESLEEQSPAEELEQTVIEIPLMAMGQGARVRSGPTLAVTERDENGFEKIPLGITSDSGAADTVAPEELFTDYPLEDSPGSLANVWYVGAGGQRIKNKGQRRILVLTKEKLLRWITVQVARVKKTLGSVGKNVDCKQRVVYDDDSYIEDKASGEKVHLQREKGVYKFDAWVVPYKMIQMRKIEYIDANGRKRLVRVDVDEVFSRQS